MTARYAILAGGGQLPSLVSTHLKTQKIDPFVLSFTGQPQPEGLTPNISFPLGKIGSILKALKAENITHVVMAGGLSKPALSSLKPDHVAFKLLVQARFNLRHDDALLRLLSNFLGSHSIEVVAVQDVVKDLFVDAGTLSKATPSHQDIKTIDIGIQALNERSSADLGQAVVVSDCSVVAEEGVEGTAALIASHTAQFLVKGSKIGQTMKADVPSVGIETIEALIKGGYKGLAIEAGKTFMLDKESCLKLADEAGLIIYAWKRT